MFTVEIQLEEDGLQDDDLMDFTYSQVCLMEEQCFATTGAKKLTSESTCEVAG